MAKCSLMWFFGVVMLAVPHNPRGVFLLIMGQSCMYVLVKSYVNEMFVSLGPRRWREDELDGSWPRRLDGSSQMEAGIAGVYEQPRSTREQAVVSCFF